MPATREQQRTPEVNIPMTGVSLPLPTSEDLIYYGGLGAMTALELIDWPVSLAVAAGYALATHDGPRRAR